MRLALSGAAVAAVLLSTGCTNPRTEANLAQAMSDAANQMGELQADIGQLQDSLDSLRQVVAHQDTVIARIAAVNNVPTK